VRGGTLSNTKKKRWSLFRRPTWPEIVLLIIIIILVTWKILDVLEANRVGSNLMS